MPHYKAVEILYRDPRLVVVNKPAAILSIPGRDGSPSLVEMLRDTLGAEVYIVHRLDRDTSGVLLFALDAKTHRILSEQFAARRVRKTYLAIVRGTPAMTEFNITFPLKIGQKNLVKVDPAGKPSETVCRVIEGFGRYSFLEIEPLTGRQHQIRVHLAAAGHPLLVDPEYGSPDPFTIRDIKPAAVMSDSRGAGALLRRTPLHAATLEIRAPDSDAPMTFQAAMPKDMRATLQQLRKWSR